METKRGISLHRIGCYWTHLTIALLTSTVVFSSCGGSKQNDESTSQLESSDSPSQSSILNFRKVQGGLYRSGAPRASEFSQLQTLGIKTVISLQDYNGSRYVRDLEARRVRDLGMKFVSIPMSPSAKPTLAQIKRALAAIDAAQSGPILIHCTHGVDRTGIVIAAYRIQKNQWSTARAKIEMRRRGHLPGLYWWDSILDQVPPSGPASTDPQNDVAHQTPGSGVSPSEPIIPVAIPAENEAPVIGNLPLVGNPNIKHGLPKMRSQPEILISRSQYVLSWNKSRRGLNWAAWEVNTANFGSSGRQNNFAVDDDLKDYLSTNGGGQAVGPNEFSGSCLDRGHQVPSADRTASVADNEATFVMSNMLPQAAYTNRVVWEHLEGHGRSIARSAHGAKVYVIAGGIFPANPKSIGPRNNIAVPSKNFKIIVKVDANNRMKVMAAAIIPNLTSKGTDPLVDRSQACEDSSAIDLSTSGSVPSNVWRQYETPVDQIEQEAGINLSFLN